MRDIIRHQHWNLKILAIFDDAESLHGLSMHGVPVKGDRNKMYHFLRFTEIDELIIAIPSLPKPELKSVIEKVKQVAPTLKIKVLPSFHLLSDDPVGVKNIREISIEDILGREPAGIDMESLRSGIFGKKILITGAGGSIGREIVRQCVNLGAKKVITLDVDETEVFHILKDFEDQDHAIQPCVANILDKERMDELLETEKPDTIFHAAAYKHVPMMEEFPAEAVKVNVEGTRIVADLACKHDVDKFILISTDKAVNPTNVMGATKRIAEEICIAYNEKCITKFIAVRFGNVLGSRGSVVPIFIDQIQKGGPVTITHPDVQRYFMTIPEAVLLVMRAGQMGQGGEVFILDMGKPVKILDMAKQLIRLHGLEPEKDIPIEMIGLRPGEKMFEELLKAEEGVKNTEHNLIYKAVCSKDVESDQTLADTANLLKSVRKYENHDIRSMLKQIVPSYSHRIQQNGNSSHSHSSLRELTNVDKADL
jgi:FlaA1/EpsC-like NDP-sugar epimerase